MIGCWTDAIRLLAEIILVLLVLGHKLDRHSLWAEGGHVCRENNLPWCTITASPSLLRGSFPRYYMTLSVASYLDLSHSQAVVSITGDHMICQYTVNACRIRPRTDISVSRGQQIRTTQRRTRPRIRKTLQTPSRVMSSRLRLWRQVQRLAPIRSQECL